jgi:hypothetical protein
MTNFETEKQEVRKLAIACAVISRMIPYFYAMKVIAPEPRTEQEIEYCSDYQDVLYGVFEELKEYLVEKLKESNYAI